jgi:CRISPR-associated endonuclease Csn1
MGQAHQETIRSAKLLDQGLSAVKTPLENLKLKDMERILGWDDPRNATLIDAIRQRLKTHGDDGKKAFKEPLYKPSKPGRQRP